MRRGLQGAAGAVLVACAAWAIAEVPAIENVGFRTLFLVVFVIALLLGAQAVVRGAKSGVALAVTFLGSNLAVGVYVTQRGFWALLLYVILLIAFVELHQFSRFARRLPVRDPEGSGGAMVGAALRMLALLGFAYAASLLLANVAAVTSLGTTGIISGFILGVGLLAVLAVLAALARSRPQRA